MTDTMNDTTTTPATESQHPRTNEGACVSADIYDLLFAANVQRETMNEVVWRVKALEERYALDMETFATGSRMNAAVLDSVRARITEIVDAVKAERECEKANEGTMGNPDYYPTWRKWQDTKAHLDAMVRKHEAAGKSVQEAK